MADRKARLATIASHVAALVIAASPAMAQKKPAIADKRDTGTSDPATGQPKGRDAVNDPAVPTRTPARIATPSNAATPRRRAPRPIRTARRTMFPIPPPASRQVATAPPTIPAVPTRTRTRIASRRMPGHHADRRRHRSGLPEGRCARPRHARARRRCPAGYSRRPVRRAEAAAAFRRRCVRAARRRFASRCSGGSLRLGRRRLRRRDPDSATAPVTCCDRGPASRRRRRRKQAAGRLAASGQRRLRSRRGAGHGRRRRRRRPGHRRRLRPAGPLAAAFDPARRHHRALRHSRRPAGRYGAGAACRRPADSGARAQPRLRPAAGRSDRELCVQAHLARFRCRQRRRRQRRRHRHRDRRDPSGARRRDRRRIRRHARRRQVTTATTAPRSPA